ncbi:hypothetical protein C8Q76DRAFT_698532 [Earliella scabrosa]|nr:hypothetical protein C8Q76DRAFT_698532 [Earliella scabrosa]
MYNMGVWDLLKVYLATKQTRKALLCKSVESFAKATGHVLEFGMDVLSGLWLELWLEHEQIKGNCIKGTGSCRTTLARMSRTAVVRGHTLTSRLRLGAHSAWASQWWYVDKRRPGWWAHAKPDGLQRDGVSDEPGGAPPVGHDVVLSQPVLAKDEVIPDPAQVVKDDAKGLDDEGPHITAGCMGINDGRGATELASVLVDERGHLNIVDEQPLRCTTGILEVEDVHVVAAIKNSRVLVVLGIGEVATVGAEVLILICCDSDQRGHGVIVRLEDMKILCASYSNVSERPDGCSDHSLVHGWLSLAEVDVDGRGAVTGVVEAEGREDVQGREPMQFACHKIHLFDVGQLLTSNLPCMFSREVSEEICEPVAKGHVTVGDLYLDVSENGHIMDEVSLVRESTKLVAEGLNSKRRVELCLEFGVKFGPGEGAHELFLEGHIPTHPISSEEQRHLEGPVGRWDVKTVTDIFGLLAVEVQRLDFESVQSGSGGGASGNSHPALIGAETLQTLSEHPRDARAPELSLSARSRGHSNPGTLQDLPGLL